MVIKRIGVVKAALFQACFGVAMGILVALIFMAFGSMLSAFGQNAGMVGMLGGLAMLIIMPIFYGVVGFIFGALFAAVYNLIASIIGGIEIDVE